MNPFVFFLFILVGIAFVGDFFYKIFFDSSLEWMDIKDLLIGCAFIVLGIHFRNSKVR
jgi:hypothetical protein